MDLTNIAFSFFSHRQDTPILSISMGVKNVRKIRRDVTHFRHDMQIFCPQMIKDLNQFPVK